jgi:hypothetical protein|tara:strand:+ start:9025 stop:9279 length:255 start_codon:yes stop_codon:yes gene_type:complete
MKNTLRFLFFLIIISLFTGFYIKNIVENDILGEKIIGSSVVFSVTIFLPIFLFHRWKGKDIRHYTLTKENFERMKNTNEIKKNN